MNRASSGLAGVWKLLFFEARDAQGRLSSPLGSAPAGYLIYTKDGHVSVLVASGETATNGTIGAGFRERVGATEECAYSGRYELGLDHVVHHVLVSLPHGLAGSSLKYFVQLEGDRLLQYVPPALLRDRWQAGQFIWERAGRRAYPRVGGAAPRKDRFFARAQAPGKQSRYGG